MGIDRPQRWAGLHVILCMICAGLCDDNCRAEFVKLERNERKYDATGAIKYENEEWLILEGNNGAQAKILKSQIVERKATPEEPPLTPEEMAKSIQGDDPENQAYLRIKVTPEVIAVLVLEAKLPAESEEQVEKFLAKIVSSTNQAADGVRQFAKKYKLTQKKPTFPAVVVMYESETLGRKNYQDDNQTVGGVCILEDCGWYNPQSDRASFIMSDVLGWDGGVANVLIWQQLFHTQMLKRHAPVPLWFVLGASTGFDAQTKITPNHLKLSPVTFPGLRDAKLVNWDKMVSDYDFYESTEGFIFSDFRDQSWALHWLLIDKNKLGYGKYWKAMTELSPLDDYSPEKSLAVFKKAFGKDPEAFKPLFKKSFENASQNPPPLPPEDGRVRWTQNLGKAVLTWHGDPSGNQVVSIDGILTNDSPFRTRSFYLGFDTTWGKSAVWFVDNLAPQKSFNLKLVTAADPPGKKTDAEAKGEHRPDDVWIRSVLSDSPEAAKWRKGELPPLPIDKEEPE